MINWSLNSNFSLMNQGFYQIPTIDWFYFSFSNLENFSNQTLPKLILKGDERSNVFVEVKIQSTDELIQFQVPLKEETKFNKVKKNRQQILEIQDDNYITKSQKEDRNLNSIVIRNFAKFVNNHPCLLKIVETIIQNKKFNISAVQYQNLFKNQFPARRSYVGVGKLKSFVQKGKQHCQIRVITLILLRKFISIDFSTVIINSKKVTKEAKAKQLKHGKKFWEELLNSIS